MCPRRFHMFSEVPESSVSTCFRNVSVSPVLVPVFKTVRASVSPLKGFCSLFYVIDTGSIRPRARILKMAKYEKNRSTRRSTPRHPIVMASTAKPPDPMPCALTAILLPESSAPACHMRKTLFPGSFWVHAGYGCVRAVPACGVRKCGVGARRESR